MAKGSALDLCMNSLYFDDELPDFIKMDPAREVSQSWLAQPAVVYIRFHARGFASVVLTGIIAILLDQSASGLIRMIFMGSSDLFPFFPFFRLFVLHACPFTVSFHSLR